VKDKLTRVQQSRQCRQDDCCQHFENRLKPRLVSACTATARDESLKSWRGRPITPQAWVQWWISKLIIRKLWRCCCTVLDIFYRLLKLPLQFVTCL